MKKFNLFVTILLIFYANISLAVTSGDAIKTIKEPPLLTSDYVKNFAPEKVHRVTSINIYQNLKYQHLKSVNVNDQFSNELLKKYIANLDNSKVYFTESDIESFNTLKDEFDNYLKKGNLNPAFKMFNVYQRRLIERLVYMVNQLNCCYDDIDFTLVESYETDREKSKWPKDKSELDKLWHKRLKNAILNLSLSGKKPDEIQTTLRKRYKYQLKRASQLKNEDAFRLYMNSFTSLFDPHTQYFSPRVSEDFNIRMSLSLEGIGAVLQSEDDYTKVLKIVPAGPADKSGLLKAGDRIIGVGQGVKGEVVDVVGWRLDDVVQLIRGPKNTIVQLKIIPATAPDDQHTKNINITRNTVKLEEQSAKKEIVSIDYNNKKFKLGVITIPTFYFDFEAYHSRQKDYKSTTRDVKRLIEELKEEKIDGLIIDIRENGGGALEEAISLTGLFIKTGPTVIVRKGERQGMVHSDNDPEITYAGPLAVLVNRMSASASEIFAGAIKDYKRGLVLGAQTFGKGTVQSLIDMNQGKLKLTIAKFYRILGGSTQNKGIIPDISFPTSYNLDEIGESSLDGALPWDTTQPEVFKPYLNINMETVVSQLEKSHQKRIKTSAQYAYLVAINNHYKALQKKTAISLNREIRKKELEDSRLLVLNIENKLRLAKGEKPYKDYDSYKEELEKEAEEKTDAEEKKSKNDRDFVLSESENILIDYIQILKSNINTYSSN